MGRGSTTCSTSGLVLFASQHGIRLPEFKCQQLLTLGCCVTLDKSLSLSEPLSCLTYKMGATEVAGTSEGMCEVTRGCSHTKLRGLPDLLVPLSLCCCRVRTRLQLPDSPSRKIAQAVFLWGPQRSHLHSDHQDLHYLQHQLEGLATFGPKFVTGTHEKVLETAAEVFLFQTGWSCWRTPRLGPIPGAGSQEVLGLWGNGREQWEPSPGRSTANRGGRSHVPAEKELWEI